MNFAHLSPSAQEHFVEELVRRCQEDPWCQECAKEVAARTPAYEKALEDLTPRQREAVEDYIAACEELEYSRSFVAFSLGLETPRN